MLQTLWSYLMLPPEITAFEDQYLRRMNRVGLIFFSLHVPVFMAVAALCHTGVLTALVLTLLVLVGPAIAYRSLTNVRAMSAVFGFTAMCMGGLLVHFGQGPMQIEMHFYFFVLLALLAVFGNPLAIVVAAVTVALHHLVLYFVLPSSVFNYEASVWAVGVHALFVVPGVDRGLLRLAQLLRQRDRLGEDRRHAHAGAQRAEPGHAPGLEQRGAGLPQHRSRRADVRGALVDRGALVREDRRRHEVLGLSERGRSQVRPDIRGRLASWCSMTSCRWS